MRWEVYNLFVHQNFIINSHKNLYNICIQINKYILHMYKIYYYKMILDYMCKNEY
jgi:hypothetical protein